jgi:hypothetical protein
MRDNTTMTPADAFADIGRMRFDKIGLEQALSTIATLAKRTVPGAGDVSVALLGRDGAHTAAFTGSLALLLDEWQYEQGTGPCLAAAAATGTVPVGDTAGEARWWDWAGRAAEAGVRSSLSIGLPSSRSLTGALNLYAAAPQAFDRDAVVLARTFAGYAAVALAVVNQRGGGSGSAGAGTTARSVIEEAKAVIMADRRCSADEALTVLAKISTYSGRTVREMAEILTDPVRRLPGP